MGCVYECFHRQNHYETTKLQSYLTHLTKTVSIPKNRFRRTALLAKQKRCNSQMCHLRQTYLLLSFAQTQTFRRNPPTKHHGVIDQRTVRQKIKLVLEQAMKAQRGSRDIALLFL